MTDRIKELCRKNGITIQKLEAATGLANGTIGKWGKRNSARAESLAAVAKYLGVSMEYLLEGKEKQPAQNGGLSADTLEIAEIIEALPADRRHFLLLQARALKEELLSRGTPAGSP